jgi:hypothetical protein
MAIRAQQRGRWLLPGESIIGIGCTASLATDRPKQGDHRFHVTACTARDTKSYSLTLEKGKRDRQAEEAVLNAVLLNALADAVQAVERVHIPLLDGESLESEVQSVSDRLSALLAGELSAVCVEADGQFSTRAARPSVLLPGAFNPAHEGHWRLLALAAARTQGTAAFELSAVNVDKPPLQSEEVRRRLSQFAWRSPVWVTRAPTFVEKATLFPGCVFAVGVDTAERIVATGYYRDSAAAVLDALEHIRKQGCRFLVAGRENQEGRFVGIAELSLPEAYRDLFTGMSQSEIHVPISSTILRAEAGHGKARR